MPILINTNFKANGAGVSTVPTTPVLPKPSADRKLIRVNNGLQTDATFAGLAQYAYRCWADETPMTLSPDLVYHRLLCAFAARALENPERYRALFSTKSEKQKIELVTSDATVVKIEQITTQLADLIPSKELYDLIANQSFSTDTEGSIKARLMTLCYMAKSYYSYWGKKCGIPSLHVSGSIQDWNKIGRLTSWLSTNIDPQVDNWQNYLKTFQGTVDRIIRTAFDENCPTAQQTELVDTIISIQKNPQCSSGHKPNVLTGWLLNLYFGVKSTVELGKLPTDQVYVPFTDTDSKRRFIETIGIMGTEINKIGFPVAKYISYTEEIYNDVNNDF